MRICIYFKNKGRIIKLSDKDWENVRDQLVNMRVNGGFPYITVNDGDYYEKWRALLKALV